VVITGHMWSLLVICGHLWSSLVITGHLWSSLVICGHHWSAMIITGHLCVSDNGTLCYKDCWHTGLLGLLECVL